MEEVVIVPTTMIIVDIHHTIPIIIEVPIMTHIIEGQEEGVQRLVGMTWEIQSKRHWRALFETYLHKWLEIN